ncbi:MAG: AMP-binding protein [Lachnospiraceae bacterium]|nr:AMP-binding protein [Lachnospiraceae bacterium]
MWDLERFGSRICLTGENGDNYTYSDVDSIGADIARHVGKRCLVFLLCRNVPESIIGYVSFLNHGIVPAMLAAHMDESLFRRLVLIYEPHFFWAPADMSEMLENFRYSRVFGFGSYALFESAVKQDCRLHDDLCLLLTTSGSTGSPKFVRQTYKNVSSNAHAITEYLKLDESERPITTLPMNYTYGLSIINSHLMKGAGVLVTEKGIMQKEFWDFFRKYEATSFGGVPYTYEMLDKLRFYRMDLPSLRSMTQAGGKITEKLHEKMAAYALETGRSFYVMYGQCEATARMGYLPPERSLEKKGSMGIAIPGGKFTLIDDNGNVITSPGVTGELIYEGDNVTPGYAESKDDLNLGDERQGRLETGDMAYFDGDGYFYISGRKNRFLKMFGNRVNLDETERLIKDRFSLRTACAGYDDHMYIFLTAEDIGDEVRKYVSDMTHIHRSAFKAVVLDEIPMTESGKTKYAGLENYYDHG